MSIDELSNNRYGEKRDLIAPANAHNGSMGKNYPAYRNQSIATVSDPGSVRPSLSSEELKALHRVGSTVSSCASAGRHVFPKTWFHVS